MPVNNPVMRRLPSGVRNLDALLQGGIPETSLIVFAGGPGAGKTILAQQICLHNASLEKPVIFFQTLSEPTVKTLRYLTQFTFFDQKQLDSSAHFIDLGAIMRTKGLAKAGEILIEHVRKIKPALVVIDSFKVFSDLAESREDLRKFSYKILVDLLAWECTTFLLGEFSQEEVQSNPIFSIADGIILLSAFEESGEQQRFLQILKVRGTDHSRNRHPMVITTNGINVYAPGVSLKSAEQKEQRVVAPSVLRQTGIAGLDALIRPGLRSGSFLVSGATGTGKTLFLLETLYQGAKEFNEKGIYFSFEETADHLKIAAREIGMDLEQQIKRGMLEIVEIPQADILVERDLQMMDERLTRLGAKRVAIDSLSAFLHKIKDPHTAREKILQLSALIQRAQGVGLFATDIPFNSPQLSPFGIEETVLDGIIILSAKEEGLLRQRYVEVYKLRATNHLTGRHKMTITSKGFKITPRADSVTGQGA